MVRKRGSREEEVRAVMEVYGGNEGRRGQGGGGGDAGKEARGSGEGREREGVRERRGRAEERGGKCVEFRTGGSE